MFSSTRDTDYKSESELDFEIPLYDKEAAEQNKLEIDVVINQIVRTMINLGVNVSRIARETIAKNPCIVEEDELVTSKREIKERKAYVKEHSSGASESYKQEIILEAEEKINKRRILQSMDDIDKYIRIAHNLFITFDDDIQNGCDWSRFYNSEDDEPFDEKAARIALEDEDSRTKYRHFTICQFVAYSYEHWGIIHERNIDFLASYFSSMFPNSDFTDKLEILYGNNKAKKNYVDPEDIKTIWRFIHAIVKLSIKYMYYTDRSGFKKTVPNSSEPKEIVDVDYDADIEKWEVNLAVKTDNLNMWDVV